MKKGDVREQRVTDTADRIRRRKTHHILEPREVTPTPDSIPANAANLSEEVVEKIALGHEQTKLVRDVSLREDLNETKVRAGEVSQRIRSHAAILAAHGHEINPLLTLAASRIEELNAALTEVIAKFYMLKEPDK